jgi:hypothetical protein
VSIGKRQAILGAVWLVLGVWFAASVQVWVAIAMLAAGIAWIGLAARSRANSTP